MGYLDPSFVQNLFGIPQIVDPFSVEGIQLAANPTGVPSPMWGVQQNAKVQAPQQEVPPQISALPANKVIQNLMSIESKQQKKQILPDSVYEQLRKRQLDSFKEQKQGIQDFESGLQAPQEINPLLAVTSGLSDMFAGTNRLEGLSRQKAMQEGQAKEDQRYLQAMKKDLTKAEIDMLKSQFQHEQDTDKLGMTMKLAEMKQKAEAGQKLLPGQEAADKEFGKEYADWNQKGGRAGFLKSKESLEGAIAELEGDPSLTGTLSMKATPEKMVSKFHPDTARTEQKVKSTVIQMVKQLGANPTDTDLREIQKTVWDKDLPVEMNVEKIRGFLQEQERKAAAKDEASRYFEQTRGTLMGQGKASNVKQDTTSRPYTEKLKRLEELRKKAGK